MTGPDYCAVVGYASLDSKYSTAAPQGPGRTTMIHRPLHSAGPQPGGVAYFAVALARHGHDVDLVTWISNDAAGNAFLDAVTLADVRTTAISRTGTRTPQCHLYYPDGDEAVTYFDPGDVTPTLTTPQRTIIAGARAVLIGVGPQSATDAALKAVDPDALMMWAVKADPTSMSPDLAHRVSKRADIICYSRAEAAFLTETCGLDLDILGRTGKTLIETDGPRGVTIHHRGDALPVALPAQVDTPDATGAGDTLAAGILARLHNAHTSDIRQLATITTAACEDVCHLLRARLNKGWE